MIMEPAAGSPLCTTVLVLALFTSTVTSLRDNNDRENTVSLGVGTGAQTWKLAPLSADTNESGAVNGSDTQQQASAQASATVTQNGVEPLDSAQLLEGQKAQGLVATDIRRQRQPITKEVAPSSIGTEALEQDRRSDLEQAHVAELASQRHVGGSADLSSRSSEELRQEHPALGERLIADSPSELKTSEQIAEHSSKVEEVRQDSVLPPPEVLEKLIIPSGPLEVIKHWEDIQERAAHGNDGESNPALQPSHKLNSWNPFGGFAIRQEELPNNLWCPRPADFRRFEALMTRGEMVACLLHHVTLFTCELHSNSMPSLSCDEAVHIDGAECVPIKCWLQIPYIWLEWYVIVPFLVFLVHLPVAIIMSPVYSRLMRTSRFNRFVSRYLGKPGFVAEVRYLSSYMLFAEVVASTSSVVCYNMLNQYEPISLPWEYNYRSFVPAWVNWTLFIINVHMIGVFLFNWIRDGFSLQYLFTPNAIIDIVTAHGLMVKCYLHEPVKFAEDFRPDPVQNFLSISRPNMNWQFLRAYRSLSAIMELIDSGSMSYLTAVSQQFMKSGFRLWALVNTFAGLGIHFEWLGNDLSLTQYQDRSVLALGECVSSPDLKNNIVCVPFLAGTYFMFATISSLGFGDYAPESAPAYLVVIILVSVGVVFFYTEAMTLSQVVKESAEGVRPAYPTRKHVVLTGGAMNEFDTSVIHSFIQQLFHKSRLVAGEKWPELVLLGPVEDTAQVREFLAYNLSKEISSGITFCDADPMTPEGLEAAKVSQAEMVYILPATSNSDIELEDEFNLQVALSINALTKTPFRVVLFLGASVDMAITSGVHLGQVCCINVLRTSILAQSSRVRGWAHLLMLMCSQDPRGVRGIKEHCYEALLPMEYLPSLANSIRGFALSREAAGIQFNQVALNVYRATGALPICLQTDGRIISFPWNTVVPPNTVIYVLHAKDFVTDPKASKFIGERDWKVRLQKARWSKLQKGMDFSDTGRHGEVEFRGDDAPISDGDLQMMAERGKQIADTSDFTLLVVLNMGSQLWPMLDMYIRKYRVAASSQKGDYPLVVLVPDAPPKNVVNAINSQESGSPVVFVKGRWNRKEDLIAAGILKCKLLVAFPLSASLNLKSTDDNRMFFFTQIVSKLPMRKECLYLVELASGMNSAHVLPRRKDLPQPPTAIMAEAAFHPACASGQVFVPRMLISLLGVSFYSYGVIEVLGALTMDDWDPTRPETTRPEQVRCPKELHNCTFSYAVEALLQQQMGPSPALLLALMRETLDGEAVLLKPEKEAIVMPSDLLIVFADKQWADWADSQRLRLFAGRNVRSSSEDAEEAAEAGKPFAGAPQMRPVKMDKKMTEEEEEEAAFRGIAADFGLLDEVDEGEASSIEDEQDDDEELEPPLEPSPTGASRWSTESLNPMPHYGADQEGGWS